VKRRRKREIEERSDGKIRLQGRIMVLTGCSKHITQVCDGALLTGLAYGTFVVAAAPSLSMVLNATTVGDCGVFGLPIEVGIQPGDRNMGEGGDVEPEGKMGDEGAEEGSENVGVCGK
jgi:hypothetical protein